VLLAEVEAVVGRLMLPAKAAMDVTMAVPGIAVEVDIVVLLAKTVVAVRIVMLLAKAVEVILLAKAVINMVLVTKAVLLTKAAMALAEEGSSNAPNAEASTVLSMMSVSSKAVAMSLMSERSFAEAMGTLLVNNSALAVATVALAEANVFLAETLVVRLFETAMVLEVITIATVVRLVIILVKSI
jgi:hypothetical protein